jgi:hypothetical protein
VTKQEQRDKILELQIIEKLTAMKKCQPADHEVPPDGPNSQELRRPGMPTELSSDVPSKGTSDSTQLTKQKCRDTTSDLPRERTSVESHVTKQKQRDKILELHSTEKFTAMKENTG